MAMMMKRRPNAHQAKNVEKFLDHDEDFETEMDEWTGIDTSLFEVEKSTSTGRVALFNAAGKRLYTAKRMEKFEGVTRQGTIRMLLQEYGRHLQLRAARSKLAAFGKATYLKSGKTQFGTDGDRLAGRRIRLAVHIVLLALYSVVLLGASAGTISYAVTSVVEHSLGVAEWRELRSGAELQEFVRGDLREVSGIAIGCLLPTLRFWSGLRSLSKLSQSKADVASRE